MFNYDLNLTTLPGTVERSIVCFHGYGGNFEFIHRLKEQGNLKENLISFNFPDHSITDGSYIPEDLTYGTLDELLPAIYALKQIIIEQGLKDLDFYGLSGGGGALINVIAILNTSTHDQALARIGITPADKQQILQALQNGVILLDVPFRSVEEIIALRGNNHEFEVLAANYRNNDLRPIDSLMKLQGLALHVIVFFQVPDEILSNRDDKLFMERLKKANVRGTTTLIENDDGGHNVFHPSLWKSLPK